VMIMGGYDYNSLKKKISSSSWEFEFEIYKLDQDFDATTP
jgi:hypothetical protein